MIECKEIGCEGEREKWTGVFQMCALCTKENTKQNICMLNNQCDLVYKKLSLFGVLVWLYLCGCHEHKMGWQDYHIPYTQNEHVDVYSSVVHWRLCQKKDDSTSPSPNFLKEGTWRRDGAEVTWTQMEKISCRGDLPHIHQRKEDSSLRHPKPSHLV